VVLLDGSPKPYKHCVKGRRRGCYAIGHAAVFGIGTRDVKAVDDSERLKAQRSNSATRSIEAAATIKLSRKKLFFPNTSAMCDIAKFGYAFRGEK
jgi:predicted ThiF/HesA family dinucleotide-utilizing enzyme